jgi:hypothetical protein
MAIRRRTTIPLSVQTASAEGPGQGQNHSICHCERSNLPRRESRLFRRCVPRNGMNVICYATLRLPWPRGKMSRGTVPRSGGRANIKMWVASSRPPALATVTPHPKRVVVKLRLALPPRLMDCLSESRSTSLPATMCRNATIPPTIRPATRPAASRGCGRVAAGAWRWRPHPLRIAPHAGPSGACGPA